MIDWAVAHWHVIIPTAVALSMVLAAWSLIPRRRVEVRRVCFMCGVGEGEPHGDACAAWLHAKKSPVGFTLFCVDGKPISDGEFDAIRALRSGARRLAFQCLDCFRLLPPEFPKHACLDDERGLLRVKLVSHEEYGRKWAEMSCDQRFSSAQLAGLGIESILDPATGVWWVDADSGKPDKSNCATTPCGASMTIDGLHACDWRAREANASQDTRIGSIWWGATTMFNAKREHPRDFM